MRIKKKIREGEDDGKVNGVDKEGKKKGKENKG